VPDYSIVGGNPARIIRYRCDSETIRLLLELAWWDQPDEVINELVPDRQSCATRDDLERMQRKILGYGERDAALL